MFCVGVVFPRVDFQWLVKSCSWRFTNTILVSGQEMLWSFDNTW